MNQSLTFSAGTARVALSSNCEDILVSVDQYLGAWWEVSTLRSDRSVEVLFDPAHCLRLRAEDRYGSPISYAKRDLFVQRGDSVIEAWSPQEDALYRHDRSSGLVSIIGGNKAELELIAARVVRDVMRSALMSQGWIVVHASIPVLAGDALVVFGGKGAGKTTTALSLARAEGWQLLANDRAFVRLRDGVLDILPWPAAAAVGLGLLKVLGVSEKLTELAREGHEFHPTQHSTVTEAILTNRWKPLFAEDGRELKVQFSPHQLRDWLGVSLATEARAQVRLHPKIELENSSQLLRSDREVGTKDVFDADDERYPDFLGFRSVLDPIVTMQAKKTLDGLNALPSFDLVVGAALSELSELVTPILHH